MSRRKKVDHLHRVANLVAGLQTYLDSNGLNDSTTNQKLLEIRMALLDEVDEVVQPAPITGPGFSNDRTPNPA